MDILCHPFGGTSGGGGGEINNEYVEQREPDGRDGTADARGTVGLDGDSISMFVHT